MFSFFFSSRRRHTRCSRDWSSDVCSSDLRRIMRRAMRHGRLLGLTEPFLWRTVDWVVGLMRDTYPELETERRRVEGTVRAEEEGFAGTLDTGMRLVEEDEIGRGAGRERVEVSWGAGSLKK